MFCNIKSYLNSSIRNIKLGWKRILIWVIVAVVCGYFSYITNHLAYYGLPAYTTQAFYHKCEHFHTCVQGTIELQPGQSMEQHFTASGKVVGSCTELYLEVLRSDENAEGELSVALVSEETGTAIAVSNVAIAELPEDGIASFPFTEEVITQSGKNYFIVVTNNAETTSVKFRVNSSVQSGTFLLNGEEVATFLNFGFLRTSLYSPSPMLDRMVKLTCATVLIGLALVLFCNVKEHILYLVLAIGFGIVTLFDLTPLYGFDMKFQFDSTYVVSNELLGLEGAIYSPSTADPETYNVHYYRRVCDDYSAYQFYFTDSVSDNYVDVDASYRNLRVDEGDEELILVESAQGFVSDQIYILYLPQAIGFSIARLLGLRFIPMLQLGRLAAYATFVLLTFLAIRALPFGKRLMLILALTPAVLTQTVSVTRDATIFSLCFFLIAKVLQAAYADHKPTIWNWTVIIGVSALLAPCKAVYLPIGFLWLLIIYRQYIYHQEVRWRTLLLHVFCCALPILISLVAFSSASVVNDLIRLISSFFLKASAASNVSEAVVTVTENVSTPVVSDMYSFSYVFAHLPEAFMVLINTLRTEVGKYLINAIQLFEIDLGSSDVLTIWILLLLVIESCRVSEERKQLRPLERGFMVIAAVGVFLLTALASLGWTAVGRYTIDGLQGRYLTPVLPLLCIGFMNNRVVRVSGNTDIFVKASCCIFPAVYLMNMYLWTIQQ